MLALVRIFGRASLWAVVLLSLPLAGAARNLPLEPERKIEFDTDEATWLSLDVSPDGQTIVFELLGDLYTLPIDGGEAVPISSGMAFDSQPRYSPDGRWLAFISDRDGAKNLWIAKPDGTEPRKLTKDKQGSIVSPAWTPDSQFVVVSRDGGNFTIYEPWMYHVDGGSGIQVAKAKSSPKQRRDQQSNRLGNVVSPDNRYLYYARKTGGFGYDVRFPLWQVARRDLRTGVEDVLTQALGSAVRPALSPDGRLLVYGTRHEAQTGLRLRDLQSGQDRWLIYPVQRDEQESAFTRDLLPGYAFTPDGREVVLTFGGKIHRVNVESGEARPVPFSASVSLDLGPSLDFPHRVEQGPVRARLIQDPVLSPDGKRLAFSALTCLYVKALPDGEPRRLSPGGVRAYKPAWSPDGGWIVFVTWSVDGGQIWKIRADGSGEPRRLTDTPAFYTDPVFSPDGSRVVALRGSRYMRNQTPSEFGGLRIPLDLIWLPAEGGASQLVVPARGVGSPHFTAEEGRIFVYSKEGLLSLRYDGSDRLTHLKVTGKKRPAATDPPPAQDVLLRDDGRWALARVDDQLYLTAVPVVGGDAPAVDVSSPSVASARLTDIGVDHFAWADGGQTITWAIGSTFYRRPFESVSFESKEQKGEEDEGEAEKESAEDEKAPREEHEAVQTSTNDYFAYQDLVDMGETVGQRAFSTGPGVFSSTDFQSFEQARSYLQRYKRHYRTSNLKSYMVGNRKQRQWVVKAARELEMMPTTEGGLDLELDLTHALDGFAGNEHALPVVPLFKDVVELYARSGIGYTPTLLVLYGGPWAENHFYTTTEVHDDPKLNHFTPHGIIDRNTKRRSWFRHDEHSFARTAAEAAKILRAGGLVGVGGHGQLQGLGYHWEMWALAMGGMTPMEVLRSATLNGARIIGLAQDVGSLEPGKLADLVVLDQDPLEDIHNTNSVRYVMRNGELFDGDTLDQRWPEERTMPPFPWSGGAPPGVQHAPTSGEPPRHD